MNIIINKAFLSSDKLVYFYQPQNRRLEDIHMYMYRVHDRANKLAEPLSARYPSRDPIKPQVAPTARALPATSQKKKIDMAGALDAVSFYSWGPWLSESAQTLCVIPSFLEFSIYRRQKSMRASL